MPDKKLTDTEIKKAFELCLKCEDFTGCRECPAIDTEHNTIPKCRLALFNSVLDLINRLQAENEQLKKEVENLESVQEISPEAKYLIDTKADKVISLLNEVNKSQEQIEAEAYKEFAAWMQKEYADFDSLHEIILPENINKAINDFLKQKGVDSVV